MNNNIQIPIAAQIRVDDVAWHNGFDDRYKQRPSRTGIPRLHHPDDYDILNEIGRALDMKIGCSLVIGEWDKDNFLRGVPHMTWDPDNWNRAAEIDMDYAKECFKRLEGGEYLDYTVHGVMHGYYDGNVQVAEREFYPLVYNEWYARYVPKNRHLTAEEFRAHMDMFFKIYNSWGFTKKITNFAAPNGSVGTPEENADYAELLKEYGIYCWPNGWSDFKDNIRVINGVVTMKCKAVVDWNAFDVDPRYLPLAYDENDDCKKADFCFHWPNFLRFNPENNMERLDMWVDYFKRNAEVFGVMLSRSTPFAASQAVYHKYAKVEVNENKCIVDLSEVDAKQAIALTGDFYISFRNGTEPKSCEGGTVELYETKRNFKTYKVIRTGGSKVTIGL